MSTIQNHSKALIDDYTDLYILYEIYEIYEIYIIEHVEISYIICWWFGTFFIFPYGIGNNNPNWLSYFSKGIPSYDWIMLAVMVSPAKIWPFHLFGVYPSADPSEFLWFLRKKLRSKQKKMNIFWQQK
jgi:hypothetical protein